MRTKIGCAAVMLCTMGVVTSAAADVNPPGTKEESVPQMMGIVGKDLIRGEGVILVGAYMTSQNPKFWGVFEAVSAPVFAGFATGDVDTTYWVTVASMEALALYNIRLDKNKMSKSEIIRANFIGWNAVMVITGLTGFITGDFDKDKKITLNYIPEPQGSRLILSYRF